VISLTPDNLDIDSPLSTTTRQGNADRDGSLSVVICAYTTRRWGDLCRAVESVLSQDRRVNELIVVIDNNDELYRDACNAFGADKRVSVRPNTETPGLSGARNTGVGAARGDVIAFIDDDAYAEPGWAHAMMQHYRDPRVAGVGGYAEPIWPESRPTWMPKEFDWVVGCSYVGQPTRLATVRNPIGCNMSLRHSVLDVVGGFRSEVGRMGSIPAGCEETELCLRVQANQTCNQILFDPQMRVRHRVTGERTTLRYFLQRCYHEGLSKAVVTELANASDALSSERTYVADVLPRAVVHEAFSMSIGGLNRAAVILLGLAVTTTGYIQGTVRRWLRSRRVRHHFDK
jgi:glycosyltransferase involved in cell wall biosynthesis